MPLTVLNDSAQNDSIITSVTPSINDEFDHVESAFSSNDSSRIDPSQSPPLNEIINPAADSSPKHTPLSSYSYPDPVGLYHPTNEKDACGVGMIANLTGAASHELVRDGLHILKRMSHRGACGCDEATGDGAGILTAIPHAYFKRVIKQQQGLTLPEAGDYAIGNVFLSRDWDERESAKRHIEGLLPAHSIKLICWRPVPVDNQQLGEGSLSSEPCIEQLIITRPEGITREQFGVMLYILRKQISSTFRLPHRLYICSLSDSIIVYKGQLTPEQLEMYFIDIGQKDYQSHLILVHSRFSTNTFPSWERAQPLRCIAHNGEINTLKGNTNWMLSRQGSMQSPVIPDSEWPNMFPIIDTNTSDSGAFDNVVELLSHSGNFSIEESMLMMIPEPWQKHSLMPRKKREMYEYLSHKSEPWDGPALLAFTDGRVLGASLDRNGLRPGRIYILDDDRVILASEVGVLPHIPDSKIRQKTRLTPGEMFLIDFEQKRVVSDEEIKMKLASARPYGDWLRSQQVDVPKLTAAWKAHVLALRANQALDPFAKYPLPIPETNMLQRLQMHGYTMEVVQMLVGPMGFEGMEALGSMGNDQALPCLSALPKHIADYFQQMFAQVTNPPIDPIRESIVMTLSAPIGPEGNLLDARETDCHRLYLDGPVLTPDEFSALIHLEQVSALPVSAATEALPLAALKAWKVVFIDITFAIADGVSGLLPAVQRVCQEAEAALRGQAKLIVLTDRAAGPTRVAVPSLIAVGAVHQHLVRAALRSQVGLIVEAGDICEVHHHCLLLGFGVDAIVPYMAYEACARYQLDKPAHERLSATKLITNYQRSSHKGILKVMAKMGISTLQSYKGAQIFEAVGVHKEIIDLCFAGAASRIGGSGFAIFAADQLRFHERAFPLRPESENIINQQVLTNPGEYHWRTGPTAEAHMNHPNAFAKLQEAAKNNSRAAYAQYARVSDEMAGLCTLRGQFMLKKSQYPIPIEQVESARNIVKRFATGAMSYGSISIEAHSTLAIAMNQLGGRSNTGEGGEHISRYEKGPNGENTRSAIKQVASGRFGVTIHYLSNSDEIQIKMAQGAKPGEGGELPGHKVVGEIAKTRNSTPGVGLISPPPHHDIYSIEDLAQLIFDLKNANPKARISVKLVSEVGVGVVASGVAKGKADHILISGHDGGTGAAKWTSVKHAGMPWELGLAEAHQTLVLNGLRGRVVLQTDGQLKTGLDVIKAALFGAEEFCFATGPLLALGCIMMRKCHENTCPVGIATQDPELRAKFAGQPEHVINFFFMMAEEIRSYMAELGVRRFEQLVGRVDWLEAKPAHSAKTQDLDLSKMLVPALSLNPKVAQTCVEVQDHGLENVLDRQIIAKLADKIKAGKAVKSNHRIWNLDRAVGAIISNHVTLLHGINGLPDNTLHLRFKGSAGQSFGCWLAPGVTMELNGDANDYVGKGLSGGRIVIYPPKESVFKSEENVIVGNVCLYGATSGSCFFRGRALQRFCVRNSGATAVVEGVGDHGCEYMTGGTVVVLGSTGRNFAAGMSGGIAYVWDPQGLLPENLNKGLVQLEALDETDVPLLESLIDQHRLYTGSSIADRILWNWEDSHRYFVKVIPTEYKAVLEAEKAAKLANRDQPAPAVPAAPASPTAAAQKTPEKAAATTPKSPEHAPADTKAGGCSSCSCGAAETSCGPKKPVVAEKKPSTSAFESAFAFKGMNIEEKEELKAVELPVMDAADLDLEDIAHKAGCAMFEQPRPVAVTQPVKKRGFIEYDRGAIAYRNPIERVRDFKEIYTEPIAPQLKTQAARCMNCGTPTCLDSKTNGCPLGNKIPEWNDLVFRGKWRDALERLLETNNFPEFTGRACPAPCEGACVLGLIEKPVTIKNIEVTIIDRAWKEGWMIPSPPKRRTGKTIAIIGSGPAGLAAADQLNKVGHLVTVYERADRAGGLLMYGVPNMKLDKRLVVDRRIDLMRKEGVKFQVNTSVGVDIALSKLINDNDALILATGATAPRDLQIPGRDLKGIDFAMNFLTENTKSYLDSSLQDGKFTNAKGKRVLVIGGGDTGNDCIGTSVRHGAASVVNFELLPIPSKARAKDNPWPQWPRIFRVDYGHEEVKAVYGQDTRHFCVLTKRFLDDGKGHVCGVETVRIKWEKDEEGRWVMEEIAGTEKVYEADLVLLAMGFVGPETAILDGEQGAKVDLDEKGNFRAAPEVYRTNLEKVFTCGDARRGQSLIVWAIAEGRMCARNIDKYLMGSTALP